MIDVHTRELSAIEVAAQTAIPAPVLVTRPIGRQFRLALEALLRKIPESEGVVLDFAGVTSMDASFADEVFGFLAAQRGRRSATPHCLALRGLDPSGRDDLEMALLSRPDREDAPGLRNCVFPVIEIDGRVVLVGKAEAHVRQTFEVLRDSVRLTARDVADALGLEIAAASTRLKTLYDLGLAARTETRDAQGKQYLYHWPW